ncbi:MAG TPA: 2-amino-4-hydroxy-6-hydroxymethyldihydropteridine diphosphokinase [Phycisphaerales bacterium]|nr:2-amino-4-hydroxy-6-hydroxymethyldihydropteridine diphosphokinase [Phycisphaerales bacterium]
MRFTAAIALGSNLGDRAAHIAAAFDALAHLPRTDLIARAPSIETAPLGAPGIDAGGPYLNSAALLHTALPARDLLNHLHAIELSRGRNRDAEPRWGPRTLDLDLLVYGDQIIDEPGLTIPHPRLHERDFVLEPLYVIAPDLEVPGRGKVADLLAALAPGSMHVGRTVG